jgi:phthiocerol/phenolphthiocerol synthesis type-I polyketide synthase D
MAAGLPGTEQARLAGGGMGSLEPEEALAALEHALGRDRAHVAVMRADIERLAAASPANARLLDELCGANHGPETRRPSGEPTAAERLRGGNPEDRETLLVTYLREQTSRVLGLGNGRLPDPEVSLDDLGLESFMAFELRARLHSDLGVDLPAKRLFDGTNLIGLARLLLEEMAG